MTSTELIVCTTCRPIGADRSQPAAGQALFDAVQRLRPAADARLVVRGAACLSGCTRACTVALQAAGKHTYFFGDLAGDAQRPRRKCSSARLHAGSADGLLARGDRPERLRSGILMRLPPLSAQPDGV